MIRRVKMFLNWIRFNGRPASQNKIIFEIVLVLVAALVFIGCGKGKTSSPSEKTRVQNIQATTAVDHSLPPTYAQPTAGQSPATTQVSAPMTKPNGEPDLSKLDRSLLRWVLKNQRRPSNFQDFATSAGISIPQPPPGKKYVIAKNMHIQLVDQ